MLYLTDLVDMSVADNTDIMKSDLKNYPVDFASNKKKRMYLSTWYLENSTCGAAGDPTNAIEKFVDKIHCMTVEGLCEIIKEFYNVQVKIESRKLKRKCTKF